METGRFVRVVERGAAVRGWRAWAVVDTPHGLRLASPLFDQYWVPGEAAHASCRRDEDPFAQRVGEHEVGSPVCGCGFHAVRDPVDAFSYLRGRDEPATVCRVLGEVTLWGNVLEGESGWRATIAYPARLYVPESSLAEELAVYGAAVSSSSWEWRSALATSSPAASAGSSTSSWSAARMRSSSGNASG